VRALLLWQPLPGVARLGEWSLRPSPNDLAGIRTGSQAGVNPVAVSLKATRELWPSGLWDELPECSGSVHLLETLLHVNAC
jgi:hypothetical protein